MEKIILLRAKRSIHPEGIKKAEELYSKKFGARVVILEEWLDVPLEHEPNNEWLEYITKMQ